MLSHSITLNPHPLQYRCLLHLLHRSIIPLHHPIHPHTLHFRFPSPIVLLIHSLIHQFIRLLLLPRFINRFCSSEAFPSFSCLFSIAQPPAHRTHSPLQPVPFHSRHPPNPCTRRISVSFLDQSQLNSVFADCHYPELLTVAILSTPSMT